MKTILILVDDIYEDLELWYPKIRLQEDNHKVVTAGPEAGHTYNGKHGYPCKADIAIADANPSKFDALIIPGGYAPDKLRRLPKALELVRTFDSQKKVIAFICHAGWLLISAKVLKGRKVTSFSAIKDDMENAGAIWSDEPLVIDKNFISSRSPQDLPVFAKAIAHALK